MAVTTHKKSSYEEGSLDQYLRDISAYPLISREDEVSLAQRIRQSDQEALDKLVRSNLRFVVSVASWRRPARARRIDVWSPRPRPAHPLDRGLLIDETMKQASFGYVRGR